MDSRQAYYEEVNSIKPEENDLFYIVGSDEFVAQNIKNLIELGVDASQIVIDKHERQRLEFLAV